jgi:6,7-dimethyl-8-ribityllumazine synthase
MLRAKNKATNLTGRGLRFGVVAARYNEELADSLLRNCVETLTAAGVAEKSIRVVRVPGSFEVTAASVRLAQAGRYDCIIGLGIILQGQTSHAHHIADAVAHGLTEISVLSGIPTVLGIVTANNLSQARARCLDGKYNRGREAALTALEMARVCKTL